MSSKLFESVIVEREGYAFSVEVQYEKHPPFCSHCKFLGHTAQQCRKLVASNVKDKRNFENKKNIVQADTTREHHQDTMSNRQKHAQTEKNNDKTATHATTSPMVMQEATQHLIARNNTQAKTHTAQTMITGSKEHTSAFSGAQEALEDQSLELQNSFDILEAENDKENGDALAKALDNLVVPFGMQHDARKHQSEIVDNTTDQHLKLNARRLSFPSVLPATSVRVVDPNRLKAWVDTPVLTPMPQSITTNYASLTIDKLPSSQTLVPTSNSSLSVRAP